MLCARKIEVEVVMEERKGRRDEEREFVGA